MKKVLIAAFASVALFLGSCNDGNNDNSVTRLNVRIMDAPGAYDALLLSVKEIRVLTSEGESTIHCWLLRISHQAGSMKFA